MGVCAYSAKVGTGFAKRVRASYKREHFLAANRFPLCRKMLRRRYLNAHVSQGGWPVLVLNADFRPLSYYPLSLWSWQGATKAGLFYPAKNVGTYTPPRRA